MTVINYISKKPNFTFSTFFMETTYLQAIRDGVILDLSQFVFRKEQKSDLFNLIFFFN